MTLTPLCGGKPRPGRGCFRTFHSSARRPSNLRRRQKSPTMVWSQSGQVAACGWTSHHSGQSATVNSTCPGAQRCLPPGVGLLAGKTVPPRLVGLQLGPFGSIRPSRTMPRKVGTPCGRLWTAVTKPIIQEHHTWGLRPGDGSKHRGRLSTPMPAHPGLWRGELPWGAAGGMGAMPDRRSSGCGRRLRSQ